MHPVAGPVQLFRTEFAESFLERVSIAALQPQAATQSRQRVAAGCVCVTEGQ